MLDNFNAINGIEAQGRQVNEPMLALHAILKLHNMIGQLKQAVDADSNDKASRLDEHAYIGTENNHELRNIQELLTQIKASAEEIKFDGVSQEIKDSVSKLLTAIGESKVYDVRLSAKDILAIKPEIQFPEIKFPKPQKEIKVSNLAEIVKACDDTAKAVRGINFEFPEAFKVSNLNEIKIPEPVQFPQEALDALKKLYLLSSDPDFPIAVRLTDGEKFYKALDGFVQAMYNGGTTYIRQKVGETVSNTFATVGVASAIAVAANSNRITMTVVNDSVNTIYISKGATAVIGRGIRLNASGGAVIIDDYAGAIHAIATGAGSNLTVCEVS